MKTDLWNGLIPQASGRRCLEMSTKHDPVSMESEDPARRIVGRGPRRLRWTAKQYYRLAELGLFRNRRVELLEGDIIETGAGKPPHSIGVDLLGDALRSAFGPGHRVRIQQPLDVGRRTQPEPDAAVVFGQARDFVDHPRNALLIVEVSDTTLRFDRRVKAHLYAQAGMQDYWIVNLADRQLEVHRNPGPEPTRKGRYHYASVTIVSATESVSPLAVPHALVAVADLLP
jgi:Uma2 family endonuclease